jgi:hypothetical protein
MYNLKDLKGTYKGLIGECLFHLVNKNALVTRLINKELILRRLDIDKTIKDFIYNNLMTFDCIEWGEKIKIYEIKTFKEMFFVNYKKLKMTRNSYNTYLNAMNRGIECNAVFIILLKNWNFKIFLKSINKANFYIFSPEK